MLKKFKHNFEIVREIWKNPRYRSAIILGLYLIFFIFVFSYINALPEASETLQTPVNNVNKVDLLEQYKEMANYEYRMEISTDTTRKLIGRRYYDNQIIDFNNQTYYFTKGQLYLLEDDYSLVDNNIIEYSLEQFNPDFIYQMIKKGTLDYETKYSDEKTVRSYLIRSDSFDNNQNKDIRITITDNANRITMVELDLTNLPSNMTNYIVKIEYEFIDQISPININVGENAG